MRFRIFQPILSLAGCLVLAACGGDSNPASDGAPAVAIAFGVDTASGKSAGPQQAGLVLSGTVWKEAQPQLANKPFLIHQAVGNGRIVAFAEDPNYRAYTEATMLLFMNAVLLGPGR